MALSGVNAIGLRSTGVKQRGSAVGVATMLVGVGSAVGVDVGNDVGSGIEVGRVSSSAWQEEMDKTTTTPKTSVNILLMD